MEGPLKATFSIVHDLVDDEKYKTHLAEEDKSVKVDTKLETIKEEVEN